MMEMEKLFVCLLAQMDTDTKTDREEMLPRMDAKMEAWQKEMRTDQAKMEASRKELLAKMEADQEEWKAHQANMMAWLTEEKEPNSVDVKPEVI
jgi:uncharacterized membrane protein (DUF106 family)